MFRKNKMNISALCIAVIVLLESNNVRGSTEQTDTTLNVDEMLTQQQTTTETATTVGCSSCAAIAEETALETKISNVCIYIV